MNRFRVLLAAVSIVSLGACGSDGASSGTASGPGDATTTSSGDGAGVDGATVALENLKFIPAAVTIDRGHEVRWVWQEQIPHNVVGEGFKSETKAEGEFRHTFDSAGTFPYECTLHAGMEGKVTVR